MNVYSRKEDDESQSNSFRLVLNSTQTQKDNDINSDRSLKIPQSVMNNTPKQTVS